MTGRILAAGDHFVLPSIIVEQLEELLPGGYTYRSLTLPWPHEPFGPVGNVEEASGTEEQLIEQLIGVGVCVTQMAPFTSTVIDQSSSLRMIGVTRGGPVNIDLEAATERGVVVCNAPGRNATAAAEYAVALILALARRIPQAHISMVEGAWRGDFYAFDECGLEIGGSTVGIIGYGEIGRRVARLVHAFGASILLHDPYATEDALDVPAELVDLPDLLHRSKIVTLHARATSETQAMIDAEALALMPPGSLLVNSARGALVDIEAVCDALEVGHLGGAAFDVFEVEPLPQHHRIRGLDRVVLSPHLAGASQKTAIAGARIIAEEIGRFVQGEPLHHCLNPSVYRAER